LPTYTDEQILLCINENEKTIPSLPVQDIKTSMEFYTTKLGFTVRHHDDGFCIVVRDAIEIHLWKSDYESWKKAKEYL